MKVIVRCPKNRVTKSEMEQIIESLFQENKDLRLSESHLRDELSLSQQQSEARRQVICERDQRIQELEESLEKNTRLRETSITKMAEIQTKLYEQMREAIDAGAEINVELMEADATINEQKKRIEWLEEEVARLTNERDTAVRENTALTFDINDLQDKCEVERNLRAEAEKAYDQVASEAYDMHQQITNLTIENTRLENRIEELEAEVDTCHHNIDGYIEGNRRMRAEYEKKMEAEQDQTKYWRKKHDEVLQKMEGYKTQLIVSNNENLARAKAMEQMQEEYNELEENFDELERVHKLWGEEIDRLRKVVTNLQSTRFTTDEFIRMITRELMPSTGNGFAGSLDF